LKYAEHHVSHGDAVLAMVLKDLGVHSRTLQMVYAGLGDKIRDEPKNTDEFFPWMVKNKTTSKAAVRWVF
jgi:hypothetical protein